VIGGPLFVAARRIRARPWTSAALVVALAAAGTLLGWGGIRAAQAQEQSIRARFHDLAPQRRAFRVLYYTLPFDRDVRAAPVAATVRSFRDVAPVARRIRIWHSVVPDDPTGMRLVVPANIRRDVRLVAGRFPALCRTARCEVVAVAGKTPIGAHIRLGRVTAVVVGRGRISATAAPDTEVATKAIAVDGVSQPFAALAAPQGSTVVVTAPLVASRVHAYALGRLRERFRSTIARLERGDDLVRASAPLAVLNDLESRGDVTRKRLLVVTGEAGALILAFAAFVATMRRGEMEAVDEQLTTLGASRFQTIVARAIEYAGPGLVAAVVAVATTWLLARLVAADHALPAGFTRSAVPWTSTLMVAVTVVVAAVLLAVTLGRRRAPLRVGALELAALTALGLVTWQAATTGALDPEAVGRNGAAPVILLLPALAFFVAGVILLRAVPAGLRLAERMTRRAPFARLAFVTAARNPLQAAAATTFLAVAVGTALFSVNYVATMDRQARDAARFAVGARWRTVGPARGGTPAIRLEGAIRVPQGNDIPVRVLAVPASRIPAVYGWRDDFSTMTRDDIAQRLRPTKVRLTGPALARDATQLRVYARAKTDFPRAIVLYFLLPRQRFAQITIGLAWHRWRLLSTPVPPSIRGAQLVAVDYQATKTPISFKYDPEGTVDLSRIQQRTGRGWSALPPLSSWTATTLPTGTSGLAYATEFRNAPVRRGLRFEINGTLQPVLHPGAGLPPPLPGFMTGALPALVSRPIGTQAVDRLFTVDVAGRTIPLHVIGTSRLFPTIVKDPTHFVVIDYATLFAALNSDNPGIVTPNEGWSLAPTMPSKPTLSAARLERRLRNDPLAAGTRAVLTVTAALAAALALVGLVVAARSAAVTERPLLAEYETLGAAPASLRRSAQLRVLALSVLGLAAGVAGAFVAVRLIAAFVAVTGSTRRALPPIVPLVAWGLVAAILALLVAAAMVAAAAVAAQAVRGTVAGRLRA
jgi:hypothetical protein